MRRLRALLYTLIASAAIITATATLSSCEQSAKTLLEACSEEINTTCPVTCDVGLTLSYTIVEDDNFVYVYSASEDYIMGARTPEAKMLIMNEVSTSARQDSNVKTMLKLCQKANVGIEYRYVDSYGNSSSIVINSYDIVDMI